VLNNSGLVEIRVVSQRLRNSDSGRRGFQSPAFNTGGRPKIVQ
jgi:hypothetical protein